MCVSCHSGYEQPDMAQTHAITMQDFPEARISDYALILLRLWVVGRLFWHGILTGQKNHRSLNAVIVRFYRLGRIINIMGHVSKNYNAGKCSGTVIMLSFTRRA